MTANVPSPAKAFNTIANIRIVRNTESGIEILYKTGSIHKPVAEMFKDLKRTIHDLHEILKIEQGWRIQVRGRKSDWHDYKP